MGSTPVLGMLTYMMIMSTCMHCMLEAGVLMCICSNPAAGHIVAPMHAVMHVKPADNCAVMVFTYTVCAYAAKSAAGMLTCAVCVFASTCSKLATSMPMRTKSLHASDIMMIICKGNVHAPCKLMCMCNSPCRVLADTRRACFGVRSYKMCSYDKPT